MKAIIMAAGKSTRTYPLTATRPKPLLPVANKPILQHQLEALEGLVDGVVLVVGYKHEMIRERFGDAFGGLSIEYVEQTEQKGTGHAVLQAAVAVEGPFIAMNGDDLYDPADLSRLAAAEQAALAKSVQDPRQLGVFEVDGDSRVTQLIEKPKEVTSNLANLGVYKLPGTVFEILEKTPASERGEIEITTAIETLAKQSAFHVVEAEGYWMPIGYAWNLLDANEYILSNLMRPEAHGQVHEGAHLTGTVSLGRGTVVKPGAVIEGPVCIGDNCVVGPNCWIRPGTTLGHGCKVGQASELKNTIMFDGACAPHQNYVGDSVIGEKANLGCGTVTANLRHDDANVKSVVNGKLIDTGRRKFGTVIGDHVHTGINTSIYPGRKLWPYTSTLPADVIKQDLVK